MLRLGQNRIGLLTVVLSSLCFAIVPTAAKISLDQGSSLFVVVLSRCLIGFLLLIPLVIIQKINILVDKKYLGPLLMTSFIHVALIATTFYAVLFLDIGLIMAILYAFPIGIALITHFRGEATVNLKQWLCIIFVALGVTFLIYDSSFSGNLYGFLISFFGLALMILFMYSSSKIADNIGSQLLNFHLNFWAVIFILIASVFFKFDLATPKDNWGFIALILNGTFYILSYTLFFIGSKIIGITRASVLASVEPLLATLIAMAVLKQFLSLNESIGFIIVLMALYFFEKTKAKS